MTVWQPLVACNLHGGNGGEVAAPSRRTVIVTSQLLHSCSTTLPGGQVGEVLSRNGVLKQESASPSIKGETFLWYPSFFTEFKTGTARPYDQ